MATFRKLIKTSDLSDIKKSALIEAGYQLNHLMNGFWKSDYTVIYDSLEKVSSNVQLYVLDDCLTLKEVMPFKDKNKNLYVQVGDDNE